MNRENMSMVVTYFDSLYQKYGVDEKSLGWSKHKQDVRFEQVLKYLPDCVSVLDAGCGFGDMYDYLQRSERFADVDYYGIDVVDTFVDIAKKKYPDIDTHFSCENLMELSVNHTWDWVVECGLFGLYIYNTEEAMYEYIKTSMAKSLEIANAGISFNFLSDKVDYKTSATDFHASPERILEIAYSFSRRVILDNSIMPFEFSVTVWKNDSFSTETTIYAD